jgi:hypothetical protein
LRAPVELAAPRRRRRCGHVGIRQGIVTSYDTRPVSGADTSLVNTGG